MTQEGIEAEGLVKFYPKGVKALDRLSFVVEHGMVFGLLGPNGAGKSTAVKVLTTLVKPDQGRCRVAGIDVIGQPDRVRRTIGVVAQGSAVDVRATGRENLRLQGQLHGMRSRPLEGRVDQLLGRFGLTEAADRVARLLRRHAAAARHRDGAHARPASAVSRRADDRAGFRSASGHVAGDSQPLDPRGQDHTPDHPLPRGGHQLAARLAIVDRGTVVAEGAPEELKRQLRGDAIQVELAGSTDLNGGVHRALKDVIGIREVTVDGRALRARADDGGRAVPAVLQALDANRISVASVTVARPSLDDVYLKHTGRTFDAAEADAEEVTR